MATASPPDTLVVEGVKQEIPNKTCTVHFVRVCMRHDVCAYVNADVSECARTRVCARTALYCMCVCLCQFGAGPLFLQPAAVRAQRLAFSFFLMRSRLRRYLNIPRVRCTCSPACSAEGFPPPPFSLPLPAFLSFLLSVCLSRVETHCLAKDSQTRQSGSSLVRNVSFIITTGDGALLKRFL